MASKSRGVSTLVKRRPHNAGRPWRVHLARLQELWAAGWEVKDIATELGRGEHAVRCKLSELGLLVEESTVQEIAGPAGLRPAEYYQGMAADRATECPYGADSRQNRIRRGWWLAGFHDGQSTV